MIPGYFTKPRLKHATGDAGQFEAGNQMVLGTSPPLRVVPHITVATHDEMHSCCNSLVLALTGIDS